ncbi:MAG TPA: hypothetical protein VFJ90_06120, partial [Candidatus Didemnitutus sp.]|nr:hypothetical protein [Candidatus Didemnitutus sp.]
MISLLRTQPLRVSCGDLGIAWMCRGNALQKQNTSRSIADAVNSYNEAIALLGAWSGDSEAEEAIPFAETRMLAKPAAKASALGAAWMNRGHAWQRLGTPQALKDAVVSYDHALEQLTTLPLDECRAFRINLAATAMNRANALLAFRIPLA